MTSEEMRASIRLQLDRLRDPAGFFNAGIPNYDHLFGRDAGVTALQMLHQEPAAAEASLRILTKFQGRRIRLRREEWPGKILHEHFPYGLGDQLDAIVHSDHHLRQFIAVLLWRYSYYGSVDAGAWYLILLHHYYRKTGEAKVVRELWPAAQSVLTWLDKYAIDQNSGLVTFNSHFIFSLRNQSWKDNLAITIKPPIAMIEVQGYYFYALGLMAELANEVMEDKNLAQALRAQASALKVAFDQAFAPVNGVFPTAVDGEGKRFMSTTSNPGHLLFAGILDGAACDLVVKRLFQADMITPYGIRTEATGEPTFNADSYHNGSI